jgi:DNA-directed RNA polymerase specialized sigma24 family protein
MDKVRYDTDPDDVTDRLIRLEAGRWTYSDPTEANDEVLLKVMGGAVTKKDAAELLDMTRATLDKHLAKYRYRLRRKQNDRGGV